MMLLTKAIRASLPPLGGTADEGLEAFARVKFFTPDAGWTWYASEFDGTDLFFGLAVGFEPELGYFSLAELSQVHGKLGLPVERDQWFTPTPLRVLLRQHSATWADEIVRDYHDELSA
jgi:hypothetical protein